jgi:hypothetical protein
MCSLFNLLLIISNIKLEIHNEAQKMKQTNRTWQRALFALGITLCLTSAFLMISGSILGDRTTGIATVVSILGIGLISTHRKTGTNKIQATKQTSSTQSCAEVKA